MSEDLLHEGVFLFFTKFDLGEGKRKEIDADADFRKISHIMKAPVDGICIALIENDQDIGVASGGMFSRGQRAEESDRDDV